MESFSTPHKAHRRKTEEIAQKIVPTERLVQMPHEDKKEVIGDFARALMEEMRAGGGVEYTRVSEMYVALRGEKIFVRREDPRRVVEAIADHEPISVGFPEGDRYSNAALWEPAQGVRGLDNAYLEGYGHGNSVVTVIGFRAPGGMDVQTLPDAKREFAGIDRTNVRSIQGEIHPEDILFVSTRAPIFAFPEEEMTEGELDILDRYSELRDRGMQVQPVFVHRGYLFTEHLKKQ